MNARTTSIVVALMCARITLATCPPPHDRGFLEGFETYPLGPLPTNVCSWTTWNAEPAVEAFVVDAPSLESPHVLDVRADTDVVRLLPEFDDFSDSPIWSFSAWQYIPSDFVSVDHGTWSGSYFILMDTYQHDGPHHWAVAMAANSQDQSMTVFIGNGTDTVEVPYITDRWVKIGAIVDLENDWTQIYYDDHLVTEYQWTGGILGDTGGQLRIEAVDLFGNGSSSVFYDDILFVSIDPDCVIDGLDSDADGDGLTLSQEIIRGTDPCNQDSDFDGVPDGADNCPLTHNPDQADSDGDGIGDACDLPCPGDIHFDGVVDVTDLLALLGNWGVCAPPCSSDLNQDGVVDVTDMLELLANWGPCP